jgi:hypothetical protein
LNHRATASFWRQYDALPPAIRALADKNFGLMKRDFRHPSLHLKHVKRFWSVRVGQHHRALGTDLDGGVLWFWIGTHADYDHAIK